MTSRFQEMAHGFILDCCIRNTGLARELLPTMLPPLVFEAITRVPYVGTNHPLVCKKRCDLDDLQDLQLQQEKASQSSQQIQQMQLDLQPPGPDTATSPSLTCTAFIGSQVCDRVHWGQLFVRATACCPQLFAARVFSLGCFTQAAPN